MRVLKRLITDKVKLLGGRNLEFGYKYVICIVEGNEQGATHVTGAKWGSEENGWMD